MTSASNTFDASQPDAERALGQLERDVNFLRQVQQPAPATRVLLMLVVGIYLAGYALTWLIVEPRTGLELDGLQGPLLLGAKVNAGIEQGQLWRLVTHTFLHGNLIHILFNAYGLFLLGTLTERLLGTRRLLMLYGVSGLAGAAASYAFNPMPSVGASGALFGLLGALIVVGWKQRQRMPERIGKALSTGMIPWLLLSLAIGLVPDIRIDNAAHLGGLAGGTLFALTLNSPLAGRTPRWLHQLHGVFVAVLIALTVVSFVMAVIHGTGCVADRESWEACSAIWPRK